MQGRKKAKHRFTIASIANVAVGKESAIVWKAEKLKVSMCLTASEVFQPGQCLDDRRNFR